LFLPVRSFSSSTSSFPFLFPLPPTSTLFPYTTLFRSSPKFIHTVHCILYRCRVRIKMFVLHQVMIHNCSVGRMHMIYCAFRELIHTVLLCRIIDCLTGMTTAMASKMMPHNNTPSIIDSLLTYDSCH